VEPSPSESAGPGLVFRRAPPWDTTARHALIAFDLERFRDGDLYTIQRQHEKLRDWIVAEVAKRETDLAGPRARRSHVPCRAPPRLTSLADATVAPRTVLDARSSNCTWT